MITYMAYDGVPGIEIDHGHDDACFSSAQCNGILELDIGRNWQNSRIGFEHYADISLDKIEAECLYQWLGQVLKNWAP